MTLPLTEQIEHRLYLARYSCSWLLRISGISRPHGFFFQSSYVLYDLFALLMLIRCDRDTSGSSADGQESIPIRIHRAGKLVWACRLCVLKMHPFRTKSFAAFPAEFIASHPKNRFSGGIVPMFSKTNRILQLMAGAAMATAVFAGAQDPCPGSHPSSGSSTGSR